MSARYPRPLRQVDESEEVVDKHGGHYCFADSPQAAAEIVNEANTTHAVIERGRRAVERGIRARSVL